MKDEQIGLALVGIAMFLFFAMAGINIGIAILIPQNTLLQTVSVFNACLWAAFGLAAATILIDEYNIYKRELDDKTKEKRRRRT